MFNQTGIVSGLLIELIGGIAKLRVAAAELRAITRWSNAFTQQLSSTAGALRLNAVQAIAATSLPFLGARIVPSPPVIKPQSKASCSGG